MMRMSLQVQHRVVGGVLTTVLGGTYVAHASYGGSLDLPAAVSCNMCTMISAVMYYVVVSRVVAASCVHRMIGHNEPGIESIEYQYHRVSNMIMNTFL